MVSRPSKTLPGPKIPNIPKIPTRKGKPQASGDGSQNLRNIRNLWAMQCFRSVGHHNLRNHWARQRFRSVGHHYIRNLWARQCFRSVGHQSLRNLWPWRCIHTTNDATSLSVPEIGVDAKGTKHKQSLFCVQLLSHRTDCQRTNPVQHPRAECHSPAMRIDTSCNDPFHKQAPDWRFWSPIFVLA